MKIDLKKSEGNFSSINTFSPKQTAFFLDLSVLYAVLGKVGLHGEVVIFCKIVLLGKVAAVVIDSMVLVLLLVVLALSPSLHLRCRQHCAGIFNLVAMAPLPLL